MTTCSCSLSQAPVSAAAIQTLLQSAPCQAAAAAADSEASKTLMCQLALVHCRNDMGPEARAEPRLVAAGAEAEPEAASAVTYLAKEWAGLREEAEAELEARRLSAGEQAKASAGLYTDALGNVEVNLQTAEVYLRKRMMMPTPREISAHADFEEVGLCS